MDRLASELGRHPRGLLLTLGNEAAAFVRAMRARGSKILPQAARSSVTGGAIPQGEVVVSVERLQDCGPLDLRRGAPSAIQG